MRRFLIVAVLSSVLIALLTSLHADTVTGTAFIVSPDGYAITCAHVIKDATTIEISIGGTDVRAAVIAADDKNDVALIKVERTGLPTLPMGGSSTVEPGATVWVLGYPLAGVLGDSMKVTRGTVSGVSVQGTQRLVQIDAAVNPGNSGGPLMNDRGQVIGIVNAKIVREDVSGVGFAVPVSYARQLLRDEGVAPASSAAGAALDGTVLAKKAAPSVVLVKATVSLSRPVLVKTLPTGRCLSVSFSNDGKTLICAGGEDNKAAMWDLATGKLLQSFAGTTDEDLRLCGLDSNNVSIKAWRTHPCVWNAALSPDGRLAVLDATPLVLVYGTHTGERAYTTLGGLPGMQLAFTPDGEWLLYVSGLYSTEVRRLNLRTGEQRSPATKGCSGIAISPDGKSMAVCYGGWTEKPHTANSVEILEVSTSKLVAKLVGSRDIIENIRYSPDGRTIVGTESTAPRVSGDTFELGAGVVTIWDATSGRALRSIQFPGMSVEMDCSPDARMIGVKLRQAKAYSMLAQPEFTVELRDLATGERIGDPLASGWVGHMSFSADSRLLAIPTGDGVRIWRVR